MSSWSIAGANQPQETAAKWQPEHVFQSCRLAKHFQAEFSTYELRSVDEVRSLKLSCPENSNWVPEIDEIVSEILICRELLFGVN